MKTKSSPEEGIYDLVPEDDPPPATRVAPPTQEIKADAKPVLPYRAPSTPNPRAEGETIKNHYLPLWLLAGGVAIQVIATIVRYRQFDAALMSVGLGLIVGTAVMLAGILLAARFRQIDLGRFWVAVFKLSAIAIAPAALVTLLSPALNYIPFGFILGWIGEFVLYFALLGALFDLDESDTWYCVWLIFLVRLAVYFALLAAGVRWT